MPLVPTIIIENSLGIPFLTFRVIPTAFKRMKIVAWITWVQVLLAFVANLGVQTIDDPSVRYISIYLRETAILSCWSMKINIQQTLLCWNIGRHFSAWQKLQKWYLCLLCTTETTYYLLTSTFRCDSYIWLIDIKLDTDATYSKDIQKYFFFIARSEQIEFINLHFVFIELITMTWKIFYRTYQLDYSMFWLIPVQWPQRFYFEWLLLHATYILSSMPSTLFRSRHAQFVSLFIMALLFIWLLCVSFISVKTTLQYDNDIWVYESHSLKNFIMRNIQTKWLWLSYFKH